MKSLNQFALDYLTFSLQALRTVSLDEQISRFIPKPEWMQGGKALPVAFMPTKDPRETSMFRLTHVRQWRAMAIGRLVASCYRNGKLCGRARVAVEAVTQIGLSLKPDKLTLHIGIRGWPEKPKQMHLAQLLASAAETERY